MRFGVLSFSIAPYERLAESWRRYEAMGFDEAWIADDISWRGYADFESWSLLGALALETHRLRLGTLVTTIRFRHPAFLAAQVLTVDSLSGGRAAVAIGAGEPYQNRTIGSAVWATREAMKRLSEQANVLDTLLRGEPLDHPGPFYPTHVQDPPQPVSRPRPPLIVAAHGTSGIRAAARHADAWNCMGGQPYGGGPNQSGQHGGRTLRQAQVETRRLMELVDQACFDEGRDPATLDRMILAYLPKPDPFSSLNAFDEYVGSYEQIGIGGITFYWPPIDEQLENKKVSPDALARFERIVGERIGPSSNHQR